MRRRHAISPGFSGHYQDLGISSKKGVVLCHGTAISVATQVRSPAVAAPGAELLCPQKAVPPAVTAIFKLNKSKCKRSTKRLSLHRVAYEPPTVGVITSTTRPVEVITPTVSRGYALRVECFHNRFEGRGATSGQKKYSVVFVCVLVNVMLTRTHTMLC